jgi:hypothetical protein
MGNLFSNHRDLLEKYIGLHPNFDFYISVINNLNDYQNDYQNDEKNNAINDINKLKLLFDTTWNKYDLKYFNNHDHHSLKSLIELKKDMTREATHKCAEIYKNLIDKLNIIIEEDNQIYK